jgi:hypothetical protein
MRVAEDFAPFNVDVTTEYVGGNEGFINRIASSDQNYGVRILIAPGISSIFCSGCGGISWVGFFNDIGNYFQTSLVFPENLQKNTKFRVIADSVSHEAGHHHDGTIVGKTTTTYYTGQGTGWAPIMGSAYSQSLGQWSKGEYKNANNKEDDLAIMARYVPYIADDYPDAITAAASQKPLAGAFAVSGIIGRTGDVDVFPLRAGAGLLAVNCSLPAPSPNLDALVELVDATGAVLAWSNPVDSLAANLRVNVTTGGLYYLLRVQGEGKGNASLTGYSNYGSMGQYVLSGNAPETSTSSSTSAATTTSTNPTTSTTPPDPAGGFVDTTTSYGPVGANATAGRDGAIAPAEQLAPAENTGGGGGGVAMVAFVCRAGAAALAGLAGARRRGWRRARRSGGRA